MTAASSMLSASTAFIAIAMPSSSSAWRMGIIERKRRVIFSHLVRRHDRGHIYGRRRGHGFHHGAVNLGKPGKHFLYFLPFHSFRNCRRGGERKRLVNGHVGEQRRPQRPAQPQRHHQQRNGYDAQRLAVSPSHPVPAAPPSEGQKCRDKHQHGGANGPPVRVKVGQGPFKIAKSRHNPCSLLQVIRSNYKSGTRGIAS